MKQFWAFHPRLQTALDLVQEKNNPKVSFNNSQSSDLPIPEKAMIQNAQ